MTSPLLGGAPQSLSLSLSHWLCLTEISFVRSFVFVSVLAAAVHLSRLEEEIQIEEWGMVEGGHDLDRADQNVRVAAPAIFMRLYKGTHQS